MKSRDLAQAFLKADRQGVWAFTPETCSALLGVIEPRYLRLKLKRLSDRDVLTRAARGVYVNPYARSLPGDVRRGLIRFLRPREFSYVSLEAKLSEAGVISQVATVLTCMTTGSPGRADTPWGTIEFTHTDRAVDVGKEVTLGEGGVFEATIKRAARDLRRVRRNIELIDEEFLADAISGEASA